jgi:hypothetical protein
VQHLTLIIYPLSFWVKKMEYYLFWIGNLFLNRWSDFYPRMAKWGVFSLWLATFYLTKSLSCKVAVIFRDAIFFRVFISKKCFKMLKEDSMHIPTQRSRIPSFRLDGPVMHPDVYLCQEDSQCSNLNLSWRHGNTSGCTSWFEKN